MKATIKGGKLPDAPEPTKAVRIDLPEDFSQFMNPPEDDDELLEEEPKPKQKPKPRKESNGKRGKDQTPRKKRMPWTQTEIDEMLLMHKKGYSQTEIAEALNRSRGNVSRKLAEHESEVKRLWMPPNENKKWF